MTLVPCCMAFQSLMTSFHVANTWDINESVNQRRKRNSSTLFLPSQAKHEVRKMTKKYSSAYRVAAMPTNLRTFADPASSMRCDAPHPNPHVHREIVTRGVKCQ